MICESVGPKRSVDFEKQVNGLVVKVSPGVVVCVYFPRLEY